jgi:hypothetical protein
VSIVVDTVVAVVSVVRSLHCGQGTCAAASSLQRSLPAVGLPTVQRPYTTDVVNLVFSPYPSIFSPLNRPLIYCGRAGSPGACSQTCCPDIALVRAARLPGPTRRALSGILAVTRNRVRTRAIGPFVRTPLVIGNVRFTRFLCVNFGAHAPSTVAEIVNKLTVPTVGMSVCELFYRKASRPLSSVLVCL